MIKEIKWKRKVDELHSFMEKTGTVKNMDNSASVYSIDNNLNKINLLLYVRGDDYTIYVINGCFDQFDELGSDFILSYIERCINNSEYKAKWIDL